jgi:hypothetical protein
LKFDKGVKTINSTIKMKKNIYISAVVILFLNISISAQILIKDIKIGSFGSTISLVKSVNNLLYFAADDGINGNEVWRSDGTSTGTFLVKNVNANDDGLNRTFATRFANIGNTLFFAGNDNINGFELWKSDGSESGTTLVKDIRVGSTGGFDVTGELISYNGFVYFSADNGTTMDELWKSDGSAAGTVLVKNIAAVGPSYVENFTISNNILFFTANDGNNGQELWKTDGTATGTVMIKNIASSGGSSPTNLTDVNGILFFSAYTAANGIELWKSDGTTVGTVMVKDIKPGAENAFSTSSFFNMNGTLYFSADDGINGEELWKSDGTSNGTVMVKDIRAGSMGGLNISNIQYFQAYKGFVYFSANDGTTGVELWKSDGTSNGTVLVKDIRSGNMTSDLKELIVYNDLLYFSAYDGLSGTQLWKSDGTSSGTMLAFTKGPSSARSLTVMGDNLYFRGSSTTTGEELYKYDGSAAIPNDSIMLSVNSLNFTKSSSTKQVQLTSNTSWVTSGKANWVTITPSSGGGNSVLNITASANTSSSIRSNTITFTAGTATKTLLITQDATVSVSELNKYNYLNIYPNPTSGIVTISSTQTIANIEVFDVTGKLVYNQQNNNHQSNLEINLSALSNGIYFINTQNKFGGISKSKLVINK